MRLFLLRFYHNLPAVVVMVVQPATDAFRRPPRPPDHLDRCVVQELGPV